MVTTLLGLPELAENQSAKYLTHNEALAIIEILMTRVLSRTNGSAPAAPSEGDAYIMDVDTGDWSDGVVNDLAIYYSSAWHFITPINGTRISCVGEDNVLVFDGAAWQEYGAATAKKWALILG